MNFRPQAGYALSMHDCQVCDGNIDDIDAVYYESDSVGAGDDQRIQTRVWHGGCWEAVRDANDKGQAEAFEEAARIAKHNPASDVVTACQSRASQLRIRLRGESGADVFHALFGDLGKAS